MNTAKLTERRHLFAAAACIDRPDVDMVPRTLRAAGPALALCARCPLTTECLTDLRAALDASPTTHGVWGGHFIPSTSQNGKAFELGRSRRKILADLGLTTSQAPEENHTTRRRIGGAA